MSFGSEDTGGGPATDSASFRDPPRPPKRGLGCLGKGCLGGCAALVIVPLVVIVVFAIGFKTRGSDMVAERLDRWRAENQAVDYALTLADFVKPAAETPAGETRRVARETPARGELVERSALPADLALYTAARHEVYSLAGEQVTAFQTVTASRAAVLAHFRTSLPREGWQLASERSSPSANVLVWKKSGRTAKVEIVDGRQGTEIWIRGQPSR